MGFNRSRVWWRAFRFHYASASFMPAILGGMIAWTTDGEFHPGYFLLVLLGLTLNHCALNMTDDYYDFRHLVDALATDRQNPYTGGSGTLSTGLIEPKAMRNVFSIFYVIAIGIGIFLGVMRGPFVFFLLVAGFLCAFFYTSTTLRLLHSEFTDPGFRYQLRQGRLTTRWSRQRGVVKYKFALRLSANVSLLIANVYLENS